MPLDYSNIDRSVDSNSFWFDGCSRPNSIQTNWFIRLQQNLVSLDVSFSSVLLHPAKWHTKWPIKMEYLWFSVVNSRLHSLKNPCQATCCEKECIKETRREYGRLRWTAHELKPIWKVFLFATETRNNGRKTILWANNASWHQHCHCTFI